MYVSHFFQNVLLFKRRFYSRPIVSLVGCYGFAVSEIFAKFVKATNVKPLKHSIVMKRFFTIATIAFAALMVSCTSVEDKAKQFISEGFEAGKAGNTTRIKELIQEEAAYFESLSEKDKVRYKATIEKESKRILEENKEDLYLNEQ